MLPQSCPAFLPRRTTTQEIHGDQAAYATMTKDGLEQRVVYFSIALRLDDIPAAAPCSYCGSPMQKELLTYETGTESLIIAAGGSVPGYGCTGCGEKVFPATVFLTLLEKAAKKAQKAGESQLTAHFTGELRLDNAAQTMPIHSSGSSP